MKFKVGDKVKFLNATGGGVVSKIISTGMVNVAIEEGFDVPVLISEIIKIETEAPADSPVHFFRENFKVPDEINLTSATEEQSLHAIPLSNNPGRGVVAEGIYLAFVPHDQKWLITGLVDIYLVNHTSYKVLYSLFLENEQAGYEGLSFGSVHQESMLLLETDERDQIGKWERGIVQVLYHRAKDHKILTPGNSRFRIKSTKFYQEGNYRDSAILSGKAILISLIPMSSQVSLVQTEITEKETVLDIPKISESKESVPEQIIDKHRTSPREAVVDLHIAELINDFSKLDNSEILRIQVNYFTKCLENAIMNQLTKVTFIHGVGTGVLKTTIKQILKDYPNIEYRDASMQQFGYGAMDVIIRK
jgi:hypothetical protein